MTRDVGASGDCIQDVSKAVVIKRQEATESTTTEPHPEVTKLQELVYELKIEQIMTRNVITVSPGDSMRQLKEALRLNRISGAPVLEDGRVIGIISVEDLIKTLERGEIDSTVGDSMTSQVQSVFADESVIQAVTRFGQTGFGRLPVVDRQGELVGMLTQGDVARGLLKQLEMDYHEEEIHRYRASHIFEDIV